MIKFPGYFAVYQEGIDDKKDDDDEGLLPSLNKGDVPAKKNVEANQHFTQPPPRFSEASLVKRLEELGIGRPSTYASTIQTLRDRDYVRMEKSRFHAFRRNGKWREYKAAEQDNQDDELDQEP